MPNKKITFRRDRVLEKIQRGPIRYATLAGSHAYAVRKRLRPIIERLESARAGALTPGYRKALETSFGDDWKAGHAKVKAEHERIRAARIEIKGGS